MGRPATKLKEIQQYLLAEAASGRHPTLFQAADATNSHYMTVSRARTQLVASGQLPAPPRSYRAPRQPSAAVTPRGPVAQRTEQRAAPAGRVSPSPPESVSSPVSAEEDTALLRAISVSLSPEEQREELSRLARDASRDEVRVSALSALARLDSMTGSQAGAGIPPPLTEEDRIARLSTLCRAVGENVARLAFKAAFGTAFGRG